MTVTKEQQEMLDNAPVREVVKPVITKKRVAIAAGVAAVGAGAYFFGPKILKKVQLRNIAEVM